MTSGAGNRGWDWTWVDKASNRWVLEVKNSARTNKNRARRWDGIQRWVESVATEVIPELTDDQVSALWNEIVAVLEEEATTSGGEESRERRPRPNVDRKLEPALTDWERLSLGLPTEAGASDVAAPHPDKLTTPIWKRSPSDGAAMAPWNRAEKLAALAIILQILEWILTGDLAKAPTAEQIIQIIESIPDETTIINAPSDETTIINLPPDETTITIDVPPVESKEVGPGVHPDANTPPSAQKAQDGK